MGKDLVVIAGFLGAGKTTLLSNLIAANKDRKLGVLINDFGEIPVDAALIAEHDGIVMADITGGSIFCACRQDSFIKALIWLADQEVDMVVVEASGNSDPTNIMKILSRAGLEAKLRLTHTLCLFDPVKSYKLSHVLEVIAHQVTAADVVLLSKSDVTTQQERHLAKQYVHSLNKDVPIIEITGGMLDFATLPPRREGKPVRESTFQPALNRPSNFVIHGPVPNLEALLAALSNQEDILRVKGFLPTPQGAVYISDTGRGFEVIPSDNVAVPLNVLCRGGSAQTIEANLREHSLI